MSTKTFNYTGLSKPTDIVSPLQNPSDVDLNFNSYLPSASKTILSETTGKYVSNLNEDDFKIEYESPFKDNNSLTTNEKTIPEEKITTKRELTPEEKKARTKNILNSTFAATSLGFQAADNLTLENENFSESSKLIDEGVHAVSGALMQSGNPWLMAGAAVLEGTNYLTKAVGKTTPGFDVNIGSSGYSQDLGHYDTKAHRAWFGANKLDKEISERNAQAERAIRAKNLVEDIKFEQQARQNSVEDVLLQNQLALAGGLDSSLLAAKKGAKLCKLRNYQAKLKKDKEANKRQQILNKEIKITKAENGAKLEHVKISEEPNVIPSGALHKNKNHLDLEGITKKGIPVITVENDSASTLDEIKQQGGSLIQHAEVEKEEVILNKSLTERLEKLRDEYAKNQNENILKQAGMILAKEIVENTIDNTNVTENINI